MNSYEHALSLGIEDRPDVVDLLNAVTSSDIDSQTAKDYLRASGLWKRKPTGDMYGSLQNAYVAGTEQLQQGLDDLYTALYDSTIDQLHTATNPDTAYQFSVSLNGMVAAGFITQADVDGFYDLDGGLLFGSLTQSQFDADKAAYESAQADAASKENLHEWAREQHRIITDAIDAGEDDKQNLKDMVTV